MFCIVNLCMILNMMLWLQSRFGFILQLCMTPFKGAQNDAIEPATNRGLSGSDDLRVN